MKACVMSCKPLLAAGLICFGFAAQAEVKLPALLSDHAVLQRERPIHLWGWATPDASITASFHGQSVQGKADELGKWSLYLKPEAAGGPYTLTVTDGTGTKTVNDLLVGDVWIASGQSNMEMPLRGFPGNAVVKDADKEIAAATNPRLRIMTVPTTSSEFPLNDVKATWSQCTPESAAAFSAVAYFFGREIAAKEKVPVGLVNSSWGGTPGDSWVSMNTLGSDPRLLPAFAARADFADPQVDTQARIDAEARQNKIDLAAGKPERHFYHPNQASWAPGQLYNAMIAPLTPMTITGWIWYQGETNSGVGRVPFYADLMEGLIGDWRMHFAQGMLPFLYVQISSYDSPNERWGLLRDQQRRVLRVANTGMAVSLDVGDPKNVHPPDKQTVGARLALLGRAIAYGEKVADQGPLFREVTTEEQGDGKVALRVWFDHADGLTFKGHPGSGFEIAGLDHVFTPADARVDGQTILVNSSTVAKPVYVRWGWTSSVQDAFYNADGLPASTFTSEPMPKP